MGEGAAMVAWVRPLGAQVAAAPTMAIPDWALIVAALVATLVLCASARSLVVRSRGAAVAACVLVGLATTPIVVFAGFRVAGSIVGTLHSKIWYLVAWLVGVGVSLAFARAYWKRARPR